MARQITNNQLRDNYVLAYMSKFDESMDEIAATVAKFPPHRIISFTSLVFESIGGIGVAKLSQQVYELDKEG